jgi:hypothetical protein
MFAEDIDAVVTSLKKVISYDYAWLYLANGNRIETGEAWKRFADLIK